MGFFPLGRPVVEFGKNGKTQLYAHTLQQAYVGQYTYPPDGVTTVRTSFGD